ncbi:MAG: hypothetical protein NTX15_10710 [Candidatus Kapabacteria bacterium]|nr:hypothetical protein [Candidatus Kapabacteria bacterium]
MVTRLLAFLILSAVIAACTGNDSPHEAAKAGSGDLTAADTASATTIAFAEAKLDSFVLRYKKGDVFQYRVRQFSEAGPDSAVSSTTSSHVYTKTVRAVRSDGRSVQRTNPDFVQFNAIIGEEVSIYVSPRGALLQVGDVSPIVKKMVASAKQAISPELMNQLAEQVKSAVYGSFHGQEIIPYPAVKIDSNGNWSNAMTTPLAELFLVSTMANYHIVDVKALGNRRMASIAATIDGAIRVRPLPKNAPFSARIDASSITGTSRSLLDVEGGYTISKSNAIRFSVTATIVSPKGERKTVSQAQNSRYEIELLP